MTISCLILSTLARGGLAQDQKSSPLDRLDRGKIIDKDFLATAPKAVVAVLPGHTRAAAAVAFSPDGTLLASSAWDNTVRLWKLGDARPMEWETLPGSASGVTFSPDGKMLAAGNPQTGVFLWNVSGDKPRKLRALAGHRQRPFSLVFSPDGKMLASGCHTPQVRIWKLADDTVEAWAVLDEMRAATLGISALAFSPDSQQLAAGSFAGARSLRLWNVAGKYMEEIPLMPRAARAIAWSPDGKSLACAAADHAVTLVNLAKPKEAKLLVGGLAAGLAPGVGPWLAFAPKGDLLAIARPDRRIVLWDMAGHKVLHEYDFAQGIRGVSFAGDGRHLAAALDDGSVVILRVRSR